MIAAVTGSFDPITKGHLDLIERASRTFDTVYVLVACNSAKSRMFDVTLSCAFIESACAHLENVRVERTCGLIADACRERNVRVLVRGIRNSLDFIYEKNMAGMNFLLDEKLETVLFVTKPELELVSSSNVRELIKYRQDISCFVPAAVNDYVKNVLYRNEE